MRIGSAEFRNTQFSYSMGEDGIEKFVATPEGAPEATKRAVSENAAALGFKNKRWE